MDSSGGGGSMRSANTCSDVASARAKSYSNPEMRRRWLIGVGFASVLFGCEGANASSALTIELVRPDGGNPASDFVAGTLSVAVRQGERVLNCGGGRCETRIRNGEFDLQLPIESFLDRTFIHATIVSGGTVRIGATPGFTIGNSGLEMGLLPVRVVMEEPMHCVGLSLENVAGAGPPRLAQPARGAGAAIRRDQAFILGGETEDGAAQTAIRLDQVVTQSEPLVDLPFALGRARALAFDEDNTLYVGEGGALMLVPDRGPAARLPLSLHAGASDRSALALFDDVAAVIGGTASAMISWVEAPETVVGSTGLVATREDAAVAFLHGAGRARGLLVVGGQLDGESPAEWVERTGDGVALDALNDLPVGFGGWLVPSPSGRTALWVGWSRADTGAASPATIVIRGCPEACAWEPGPVWDRARLGAMGAMTPAHAFWILGGVDSTTTERVVWSAESPFLEMGPELGSPRADGVAFTHASGIVTVAGGLGPDGLRDDIEQCYPAALDPL